jgi:hypothetical protein
MMNTTSYVRFTRRHNLFIHALIGKNLYEVKTALVLPRAHFPAFLREILVRCRKSFPEFGIHQILLQFFPKILVESLFPH